MTAPDYKGTIHEYGAFRVNEFITEADFKLVNFDRNDLDTAYAENTGTISYIGHVLGKAKRQNANFKTRRDAVMAKIGRQIRDEAATAGKKATDATVEAAVRSNKEFIEVSFAANHALEVETTIEALYWAARGRRNDMEYFADKAKAELAAKNYSPK